MSGTERSSVPDVPVVKDAGSGKTSEQSTRSSEGRPDLGGKEQPAVKEFKLKHSVDPSPDYKGKVQISKWDNSTLPETKQPDAKALEVKPQEQAKPQKDAKAATEGKTERQEQKPKTEGQTPVDSTKPGTQPSTDRPNNSSKENSPPDESKSQPRTAEAGNKLVSHDINRAHTRARETKQDSVQPSSDAGGPRKDTSVREANRLSPNRHEGRPILGRGDQTRPGHEIQSPLGPMDQSWQDRDTKNEIWEEGNAVPRDIKVDHTTRELNANQDQKKSQQATLKETPETEDHSPVLDASPPTLETKTIPAETQKSQGNESLKDRPDKAKEPGTGGAGPVSGKGGEEGAGRGQDREVFERKKDAKLRAELEEQIAGLEDKIDGPLFRRIEVDNGHVYEIARDKLRALGIPDRTIDEIDQLARSLKMIPMGEADHLWHGEVEPGLDLLAQKGTEENADRGLADEKQAREQQRNETYQQALAQGARVGAGAAKKTLGRSAGPPSRPRPARSQQSRDARRVQTKTAEKKQARDASAAPQAAAPDRSKAEKPKATPAPQPNSAQLKKSTVPQGEGKTSSQPTIERTAKEPKPINAPQHATTVSDKTLEEKLAPLQQRRAEIQAQIKQKETEVGKKGGEVGKFAGDYKKETGQKRDQVKSQWDAAAADRNKLLDERNRLLTKDAELKKLIEFIKNPPVENRQAAGRTFESRNVKFSGMPKNSGRFRTSFPDRAAPDGMRIPDHVVTSDKNGNWVTTSIIGEAEFIADSKLLGKDITPTQQLRGFIELAAKTRLKVLLLLTDSGAVISPSLHKFAKQHNVVISQMTRDPRL